MACYAFARITSPARILSFRLNATKSEIFLDSVQQHLLSMSKHLQTKRVVLIRLIKKLSNMARTRANSYRLPLWVTSERENKLVVIDSISYYELLLGSKANATPALYAEATTAVRGRNRNTHSNVRKGGRRRRRAKEIRFSRQTPKLSLFKQTQLPRRVFIVTLCKSADVS